MTAVRLGQVAEIIMGQAPEGGSYNTEGRGWPLVAGAGDFDCGLVRPSKYTSAPTKLSQVGDILIGIRASIGERALSDERVCLGRGVAALRPGSELDPRYLWHWLAESAPLLAAKGRGATFKQVGRKDIDELLISLPPLHEQHRISRILDTADGLRRLQGTAAVQTRALVRSVFVAMFGDPLDERRCRWTRARIGDLAEVITGSTPPRADLTNYGSHLEWVKSDNLGGDFVYVREAKERLSEKGAATARFVGPGAVLVTCIAGSPSSIGNLGLTNRQVAFNQQINAVVPITMDARFLYAQLHIGKQLVQAASTGGMKGLVSKSSLQRVAIIAPPLHMQTEFGRRFETIVELQSQLASRTLSLDALFAALQHRAFASAL